MATAPMDEAFTSREQLQNAKDAGYWPANKFFGPKSYDNGSRNCTEATVPSMAHVYQWQKHRLVVFCEHHNIQIGELKQLGEKEMNGMVDYVYPWLVEKTENEYKDFRAKLVRLGAEKGDVYKEMSRKGEFANNRQKYPDPEYCHKIQKEMNAVDTGSTSSETDKIEQPSVSPTSRNVQGYNTLPASSSQSPPTARLESSSSQQAKQSKPKKSQPTQQQHLGQASVNGQLDNASVPYQAISSQQGASASPASAFKDTRQTTNAHTTDRRLRSDAFDTLASQPPAQPQLRITPPDPFTPSNGLRPNPFAQTKQQGSYIVNPEEARRQLQDQQQRNDLESRMSFGGTHDRLTRSQMDLIDYGPPPPAPASAPKPPISTSSFRDRGSVKIESRHSTQDFKEAQANFKQAVEDRDANDVREAQQSEIHGSPAGHVRESPLPAESHPIENISQRTASALFPRVETPSMPQDVQSVKKEKKEKKEKKSLKDFEQHQATMDPTTVTIPGNTDTTDSDSSEAEDAAEHGSVTNDNAMQLLANNMSTMKLNEIEMPPPPGYGLSHKKSKKANGEKKAVDPANQEAIDDLVRDLGSVWISKGEKDTPKQQAERSSKQEKHKGQGKGKGKAQ